MNNNKLVLLYRYRFSLPRPDDKLQVCPGQHVAIMAEINGKKISRSYTPTDESPGQFELLIKVHDIFINIDQADILTLLICKVLSNR